MGKERKGREKEYSFTKEISKQRGEEKKEIEKRHNRKLKSDKRGEKWTL